jgi:hypothetical protein
MPFDQIYSLAFKIGYPTVGKVSSSLPQLPVNLKPIITRK